MTDRLDPASALGHLEAAEDDRPLTGDEMQAGIAAAAAGKRGRPAGSGQKEQVAIRLDRDVLAAFRADGPGWQTRVNEA